MIDYITTGEMSDHLVPKVEESEHCPYEFCECKPFLKPFMNRWFYVHNVSQERALWDQAEDIRRVVSVQLWKEIEGKEIKHQVMPFSPDFKGVTWPRPADKHHVS